MAPVSAAFASCVVTWAACARLSAQDLQTDTTWRNRIETQAQLRAIYGAILKFHWDRKEWPTTLDAACDPAPHLCLLLDAGETPIDFWGSAVSYTVRGDAFELRSFGPDHRVGTRDDLVIESARDHAIFNAIAGCYRPVAGWWTTSPTVVRLDTLSSISSRRDGRYSLQISLPTRPTGLAPRWFPIGTDSVEFEWAYGPHIAWIRLRWTGDTLRGRTDLDYLDLNWHGVLTLVKTTCEE